MTRAYDFTTGIETDVEPSAEAADEVGDLFVLGYQTQFTIADSQSTTNVTGCVFSKATYLSVWLQMTIYRSASGGSTRAETMLVRLINDGTDWVMDQSSVAAPASDDAGVDFSVVASTGQVQYASDANGGSYDAATSYLLWKIIDLVAWP